MAVYITAVVEGFPDEAVVFALCNKVGLEMGPVYGKKGKAELDERLKGYNNAARFSHWLVLRDLNHDASCAPELSKRLLPNPAHYMNFRVVVREIEAWLLADIDNCSNYFSIPKSRIPAQPESLSDPKAEFITLLGMSRKRIIREEMLPRPGGYAKEGPAYASYLAEFALYHWSPEVAAQRCDSLSRCLTRLQILKQI